MFSPLYSASGRLFCRVIPQLSLFPLYNFESIDLAGEHGEGANICRKTTIAEWVGVNQQFMCSLFFLNENQNLWFGLV